MQAGTQKKNFTDAKMSGQISINEKCREETKLERNNFQIKKCGRNIAKRKININNVGRGCGKNVKTKNL